MARPLIDSPYLYGLHDPGGEYIMAEHGTLGWVLFTEMLGSNPRNRQGRDYSKWANRGFGIMARLNHGYEPDGTLPVSKRYREFAQRCANFVSNSKGCHIWIIGNETNFAVERPGVQVDRSFSPPRLVKPGEVILPGMYANCYRQCRAAIQAVPGHTRDQVIVGGVAPWNTQTTYDGNPNGDWVRYLQDILTILGPTSCDGIAIHAYTHGPDPAMIYTDTFMSPPFQNRQYNFRTYQDFMYAIPRSMRHLPVYLTETDQDEAWRNENTGWVQRAYGEIDWWNRQKGNQIIRAVILYRWPTVDKWGIAGKAGVIEDFRQAMGYKYNWEEVMMSRPNPVVVEPTEPEPRPGADTDPIRFDATCTTADGLFAAFYRRHGQELTGYPINDQYIHPQTDLKTQDWQRLSMEEWQGAIRLRHLGEEAQELRGRIKRLERQIQLLRTGVSGPAEPEMADITAQLPRDEAGFVKRPLSDIRFVVINHTGVRPEVGADRVAQAQRSRWPGIVGQYFVTGEGHIQQTNALDEVVSDDQTWIYRGINIYVAGNFDETVPPDAQLAALAHLCAWLISHFNLSEDAIKGVSEFISTRSPGLQWLQGQCWKTRLLEQVRSVPWETADPDDLPTPTVEGEHLAGLHAQINQLQPQLDDLLARLAISELQCTRLQAEVEALRNGGPAPERLPQPTLTDVSTRLPRTPGSLVKRPLDRIQFIVFNHTAVDPSVPVERIAAAHQQRWGAILFQYVINGNGDILQTNALDEVIHLSQPWIAEGVAIAVAGNFSSEVPSPAQIKAAAALTAWLMQEYGITAANVKGASEFIGTQSPGTQWLQGSRWKDTLLAAVEEAQAALPSGSPAGAAPSESEAALRNQVQVLTGQVQVLTNEKLALAQQVQLLAGEKSSLSRQLQSFIQQVDTAEQERRALTNMISHLEARVVLLQSTLGSTAPTGPADSREIQAPDIIDIVDTLPAHPTLSYENRTLDQITHLAIHHTAAPANLDPQPIAQYHVRKDWPGIGYHFYVTPDGTVYQTNRLETISYQVYEQNHYSAGIAIAGNFTNGELPTPNQIASVGHLAAWLMHELGIPLANVIGHKEFPQNATTCPGSDWNTGTRWKTLIYERIRAMRGDQAAPARTIGHYVLFWQSADAWAEKEWNAATSYIARFRPTAGFMPEEARNAKYVTIVGDEAGVTRDTEERLNAAGCKVERLAGTDVEDTRRILDELAATGRRFKTFEP